ncbi:MAG: glycosyl hydrolase 115 family protein [Treponema sp.]|nr:glycosyl hydrolase 115 family protein [Treponema sp.]MCL2236943.1 glycosyl hydrolase 115 family protein [Treponema sp.]
MNNYIFTVEREAYEGVKRIAGKVAMDFEMVSGVFPEIIESFPAAGGINIIFATLGRSPSIEKFIKNGDIDPSLISGKREVYQIKFIDKTLVVLGSDKRGTIYGMFALSEYIGVSPLHFWGDVEPTRREKIEIGKNIETVSKEPSVKYRGFFINDEWPCFGNWTFKHFDGFTAKMYDHVFELLLRLKGNYLWPAMWSSSFSLDGPGNLNEELADIYGVVMGASHHEPCLRASEEWGKVKGPDSEYGSDWNYYTNKEGLVKYWEDGLKRSGQYEKIITIGMRGERDTSMLGSDSSLRDNIDLLKEIILKQRELIRKHVNPDIDSVPQLIALYKEVEEYFYGSEHVEGLRYWDEIENVVCMLCEDNFGFVRTLPVEEMRRRKGGFGMYYHLDYHGAPISYEWLPSTSFERIWEQMTMAYDYGVRDIWVLNVGDLKFNEVPLAYFMELAYDFEKWGTSSPNSIGKYLAVWLEKTFPVAEKQTREKMAKVLHDYIKMNAMRRPEAQNENIYHPCHYLETDRMLSLANEIDRLNEDVFSALSPGCKDAYYSLIYYPAKASVNQLKMNLYAGKNRHFAIQGKKMANKYAALVTECIDKDRVLSEEIASFKNGKWEGMELAPHTGFVRWNEDNCRYPLRIQVEPAKKPRLVVSRKDREEIFTKAYGRPMTIEVNDFLYAGNNEVILEIANDGIGSLHYSIEPDEPCDWLEIGPLKGEVEFQDEVTLRIKRELLSSSCEIHEARLLVKDKDTVVAVEIKARHISVKDLPPKTHLENNGVIVMEARNYSAKKNVQGGSFLELDKYGRSGCAMKVFPTTSNFNESGERPTLEYSFIIEETGDYIAQIRTAPVNSVQKNRPLRFLFADGYGNVQVVTSVSQDFQAGNPHDEVWSEGVLSNIRKDVVSFNAQKGLCKISIGALEAGLVLERILIYKKDETLLESYLGPPESFYSG